MIIDTHAHYDSEQFDEDREELLLSMEAKQVGIIVNMGASLGGCAASIALAEKYPFIYAGVGVHPDEVGELNEKTFSELKVMLGHEKVVCLGEIGLDYHWMVQEKDVQKKWFIRQLDLARELNMPVNIHSRDAAEDTFYTMKEYGQGLGGIIHCFSGSAELAKEYVEMGFHIGVGGVVTFKNGKKLKRVVEEIPLSAIVLETDCPYMAPTPFRGQRNNSSYIHYVVEEIARLKSLTTEEVEKATEANERRVYRLGE